MALCFILYIIGVGALLALIAEPFTMSTYFSDNSLLPGLANREFSLETEAEYYLKTLENLAETNTPVDDNFALANSPRISTYIKNEMNNFGVEVYEQNFKHVSNSSNIDGTNIYAIIRGERSTSSESIVVCIPFKYHSKSHNTLPGIGLGLAITKYFSTKTYWAKDFIILFVDREETGASMWLDSYHDTGYDVEPLPDRSGPIQAAIVLELYGREISRMNVKIQGFMGQLPNLDLFNIVIELAAREFVTPYFHNRSLPFDMDFTQLYRHHLETAWEFMKTQATMQSDGLHGLFLNYAIQALTLEGPRNDNDKLMTATMLNVGRLIEGVCRSLNNLIERFNRSYYFYIILSLRRFTSIGYYMIWFCTLISPLVIKSVVIYKSEFYMSGNKFVGFRASIILACALVMSLLSTVNISAATMSAIVTVPILILL